MISGIGSFLGDAWNRVQNYFGTGSESTGSGKAEEKKDEPLLPELKDSSVSSDEKSHSPLIEKKPIIIPKYETPPNPSEMQLLTLLRLEGIAVIEQKVQRAYEELTEHQKASDTLNALIARLADAYGDTGTLDYSKDAEVQGLIDQAKKLGVKTPEEKVLDKSKLDSFIRNCEAKNKSIDTKVKSGLNEVDQNMQMRNSFYEIAKTLADTLAGTIKKITQAIG